MPGNRDFMIGFQNHIAVGFEEFFYFVEIDYIRVVYSKKAAFWQQSIDFLQFFREKDFLSVLKKIVL